MGQRYPNEMMILEKIEKKIDMSEQKFARYEGDKRIMFAMIFFNTYVSAIATVDEHPGFEEPYGKITYIWLMLTVGFTVWVLQKMIWR